MLQYGVHWRIVYMIFTLRHRRISRRKRRQINPEERGRLERIAPGRGTGGIYASTRAVSASSIDGRPCLGMAGSVTSRSRMSLIQVNLVTGARDGGTRRPEPIAPRIPV